LAQAQVSSRLLSRFPISQPPVPSGSMSATPRAPESARSGLANSGMSVLTPRVPEVNHVGAFYKTSNSDYDPQWAASGSYNVDKAEIPSISAVLGMKERVRAPVRPKIDFDRFVLQKQEADEVRARQCDAVLSADVLPVKFPSSARDIRYPEVDKRGAKNPLYETSTYNIGKEVPQAHQVPDMYFPRNNHFVKRFTDSKPRFTGLQTRPSASRVHSSFDQFF